MLGRKNQLVLRNIVNLDALVNIKEFLIFLAEFMNNALVYFVHIKVKISRDSRNK